MAGSHWVVYADDVYFVMALPQDMKDPRGKFHSRDERKCPDITQIDVEEKMRLLSEKSFVEVVPRMDYLAFQLIDDPESGDRNVFCLFNGKGSQAGTIPEVKQALLDIQSFQRKEVS